MNERIVSREEFNNRIADEAAQSCVDWSNPERRKEALRYIVKQIWNEAINEQSALAERQEPPAPPSDGRCSYIFEHTGNRCQLPSGHVKDGHQWRLSMEPAAAPSSGTRAK